MGNTLLEYRFHHPSKITMLMTGKIKRGGSGELVWGDMDFRVTLLGATLTMEFIISDHIGAVRFLKWVMREGGLSTESEEVTYQALAIMEMALEGRTEDFFRTRIMGEVETVTWVFAKHLRFYTSPEMDEDWGE